MGHEGLITTVMTIIGLLFVAAISAVITARIRFPYTIGLVVIGLVVAFLADTHPALNHALDVLSFEPAVIMFVFIPILIFESAFKMNVPMLLRDLVPAFTLACPGLLLSTAMIGGLIHLLTPLPLEAALVFGCLISATDPVAVIALFKELGAPKRLTILMEGESLLNDATAIVLFNIILAVIATGILDGQTVSDGALAFGGVFLGGLAVGVVGGWLVVQAMPLVGNQPLIHITLTLVTAYASFIVAEHFLHASGIMAVLCAGLTIGYYGEALYRKKVRDYLDVFWDNAAFVANSLIFLMLGLAERTFLTHAQSNPEVLLYPVLIAIAVVVVVRFAMINTLVPVLNWLPGTAPIDARYRTVLSWGALRGAVAIALAMSLPSHFPYRWQIIDFTFGVTLFTLLVNGTTMGVLMRWLGLDKPTKVERYLGAYADAAAARSALQRIEAYQPVLPMSTEARGRRTGVYRKRLEQAELILAGLRIEIGERRETRRNLLWLQTLSVRRKVYAQRMADGLLSRPAHRLLNRILDNQRVALEDDRNPIPDSSSASARVRHVRLPTITHAARIRHSSAVTEEQIAIIASIRAVLAEMERITELCQAEAEDVVACTAYYNALEESALAELQALPEASADLIGTRMIDRLAYEARLGTVGELERLGELPPVVARELRERFEMERT
ncbi:MAG: sodium:proton antiporter [Pseudomonadota bacterium]